MTGALGADEPTIYPRAIDLELIPFGRGPMSGVGSFELTPGLARHDGALYGGTGAAASVVAMEAATQRDALWVVTQFIAQAHVGETIDVEVDALAMGGRIAQLQVTGRVGDRTIFGALGATAHPRPGGLTGQYLPMPRVAPPDDCGPLPLGLSPSSGSDRSNAIDRSDRGDRSDGAGGGDRGDRGEGSDRRDRGDRGDGGDRGDRRAGCG
jgi:hypothetical protein